MLIRVPRYQITVTGRVQGVGFRWFVARAARRHGVSGFVRNELDGSVRCEAQAATADALDAFVAEVRRGPPGSRVEDVAISAGVDQPEADGGFEILR